MIHQSRGFTLIEILITTVIIAVLSGLSIAGYRYFNEQAKLERATKEFVETLESAKKMATTGNKNVPSYDGAFGPLNGEYQIQVLYIGYQMGARGTDPCGICFYPLHTATFPPNIYRSNPSASVMRYGFTAFGLGVKTYNSISSPLNVNGGFSFTLKNSVTNKTKTITVDAAGTINVQ